MKLKKISCILLSLAMIMNTAVPAFAAEGDGITVEIPTPILEFDFDKEDLVADAETGAVTGVKGTVADGTEITASVNNVTFTDSGIAVFPLEENGGISYTPTVTGDDNGNKSGDPMLALKEGSGATVSMWIKAATNGINNPLFFYGAYKNENKEPGVSIQIQAVDEKNTGVVYYRNANGSSSNGGHKLSTNVDYVPDTWQLVTFVEEADGNGTLYIDGVEKATVNKGSAGYSFLKNAMDENTPDEYHIGTLANLGTDHSFQGSMDSVAIYGEALTAEVIKELYNTGKAELDKIDHENSETPDESETSDESETPDENEKPEDPEVTATKVIEFDFDKADWVTDAETGIVTGIKGIAAGDKIVTAEVDNVAYTDDGIAVFLGGESGIIYTPDAADDPMKSLVKDAGATVAMWIKTVNDPFYSPLFYYGATQESGALSAGFHIQGANNNSTTKKAGIVLYRNAEGKSGNQKIELMATDLFTENTWQYVVFVEDANGNGSGSLYIDGVKIGSCTAKDTLKTLYEFANDTLADQYYIGKRPDMVEDDETVFEGSVDSLTVYNAPLTETEIKALYEARKAELVRIDAAETAAITVAKEELNTVIVRAKAMTNTGYTQKSWENLQTAITEAEAAAAAASTTTSVLKAAEDKITTAIETLAETAIPILEFDFDAEDYTVNGEGVTTISGKAGDKTITAVAQNVTVTKDGIAVFPEGESGITYTPVAGEDPLLALTENGGATVSMWVKTAKDPFNSALFFYGAVLENGTGNPAASFHIQGTNNYINDKGNTDADLVYYRKADGKSDGQKLTVKCDNLYTVNTWQLITYVENQNGGGAGTLYIDGKKIGDVKAGAGTLYSFVNDAAADTYYIATRPGINYTKETVFEGSIDSVTVYNKPLTVEEITEMYETRKAELDQIDAAIAAAELEAAKADLRNAISAAGNLVEKEYTDASWANLQSALTAANSALSSNDVETVKAATDALKNAQENLEEDTAPTLYIEAENGTLTGDARVELNTHASNAYHVTNLGGRANGTVTFKVNVTTAGAYDLNIYYAQNATNNVKVAVNNADAGTVVCGNTANWNKVSEEPAAISVNLKAGENTIVISNTGNEATMPNLDRIGLKLPPADAVKNVENLISNLPAAVTTENKMVVSAVKVSYDALGENASAVAADKKTVLDAALNVVKVLEGTVAPVNKLFKIEAEAGVLGGEARRVDGLESASNNCYVGSLDKGTGSVIFTINATTAGTRVLKVYYATQGERKLNITVNDNAPFTMTCTGTNWMKPEATPKTAVITLKQGANTIKFNSTGAETNAPNVDCIEIEQTDAEAKATVQSIINTLPAKEQITEADIFLINAVQKAYASLGTNTEGVDAAKLTAALAKLDEFKALDDAKKALQAAIDEAAKTYNAGANDYTETSWKKFSDAYTNATTALENDSLTKAEIEAFQTALEKAEKDLVTNDEAGRAEEKDKLDTAVKESKDTYDGGQQDYTDSTWKEFEDAYEAATNAKEDATADELAALRDALEKAQAALKTQLKAAQEAFIALHNEVAALDKTLYTTDSWNKLQKADVAGAEEYNKGKDASVVELQRLTYELKVAKDALVTVVEQELANKEAELNNTLASAKDTLDGGQQNYTDESWQAFKDAYNAALNKPEGATAADIQGLLTKLQLAIQNLTQKQSESETQESPKQTEGTQIAAPTIKNAKASAYKKGVYVKITVNRVAGADRYEIYRLVNGATTLVGITSPGSASLQDKKITKQKVEYYAVAVSADGKKSANGQTFSVKLASKAKLKKVSAADGGIKITWKKNKSAKKYVVYRSTKKNSGYTRVATVKKSRTYYVDKKAKKGKKYYYKVAIVGKNQTGLMSKASKKVKK